MPSILQKIASTTQNITSGDSNISSYPKTSNVASNSATAQQARQYYLSSMDTTNPRKRKRLLRKAARLGHRASMLELGKCYEIGKGKGTHQQLGKAIQLYKAAHCWYNLGLLAEKHLKNQKKARTLYKKALSRDDDDILKAQKVKAAYRLGTIFAREVTQQSGLDSERKRKLLMEARRCFVVASASEQVLKLDQMLEELPGGGAPSAGGERTLPPPPKLNKNTSDSTSANNSTTSSALPPPPQISHNNVRQSLPPSSAAQNNNSTASAPPPPSVDVIPPSQASTNAPVQGNASAPSLDDLLVFDDDDDFDADFSDLTQNQPSLLTVPQKGISVATPLSSTVDSDLYVDDDELKSGALLEDDPFDMDAPNHRELLSHHVEHDTELSSTSSAATTEDGHSPSNMEPNISHPSTSAPRTSSVSNNQQSGEVEIQPIDPVIFPRRPDEKQVQDMQQCMQQLIDCPLDSDTIGEKVEEFVNFIETSPEIEVLCAVSTNRFDMLRALASKFVQYSFGEKRDNTLLDRMLNAFVILIQMNKNCSQALAMAPYSAAMCFDLLTEGLHEASEDKIQLALVTVFEVFSLDSLPSSRHIDASNRKALSMTLNTLIAQFEELPQPLGALNVLSLVPLIGEPVPQTLCNLSSFTQGYLTSMNTALCNAHVTFIKYLPRDVLRQMFGLNDILAIIDICDRQIRDRDEHDELRESLIGFVAYLRQVCQEWT